MTPTMLPPMSRIMRVERRSSSRMVLLARTTSTTPSTRLDSTTASVTPRVGRRAGGGGAEEDAVEAAGSLGQPRLEPLGQQQLGRVRRRQAARQDEQVGDLGRLDQVAVVLLADQEVRQTGAARDAGG